MGRGSSLSFRDGDSMGWYIDSHDDLYRYVRNHDDRNNAVKRDRFTIAAGKRFFRTTGDRVWKWTNVHYLWTTFVLAIIADFWANWYSYAIVHDWIVLQAFLGLALPFINFPAMLYFFEHDSTLERFKICAVGAVAMMFGSTAMLMMIRAGIGVGEKM